MDAFLGPLREIDEFERLTESLKKNKKVFGLSGCVDSQKAHMIYGVSDGFKRKIIATFSELKAREICEDLRFYQKNLLYFPAKDVIFYQSDVHGNLITRDRMNVIKALIENEECTIVTPADAFLENMVDLKYIKEKIIHVKPGDILDIEELKAMLVELGYEKNYQVEAPGQFSFRGGIVDVYPLTEENPIRIEFFDDEVDTIRYFDMLSQCSVDDTKEVSIYPATEVILDKKHIEKGLKVIERESPALAESLRELNTLPNCDSFITAFYDDTVSFLDYFDEESLLILDEPSRCAEKLRVTYDEFEDSMKGRLLKGNAVSSQLNTLYAVNVILAKINSRRTLCISMLEMKSEGITLKERYSISASNVSSYNNSFEMLVKDLQKYKKLKARVILVSASGSRAKRIAKDLADLQLNAFYSDNYSHEVKPGEIMVVYGNVKKGFHYPINNFFVISETDIFKSAAKPKKKKKYTDGSRIQDFSQLSAGDYVVHENHGLGIFRGIEKVEVDKIIKDYIKIEYAKGGVLYIPVTQLDMLQKYGSADSKKPKLNSLTTNEWKKTKSRVKSAVWEIANDLVELYAIRQSREGFKYGEDTVWQKEFEEMFPYEETEDQLLAIEAVKKDMESPKIMDRLICGDVGYGKTEIAIRAAFKAVSEGRQVVYLCPTTILAGQHYNTFVQRMKDFPIRIDLLCRFRTPKEQEKTVEDLKKGMVDIVIGTHRVLSDDVGYKDLGLLIIDEEQRFGVRHKEKIKSLRKDVDVLALSATPIPRTLHMSLIGIRDMSVLEEPPIDRMPIQTFVMEYDEEMVREAINRELARGGQVYYVYNKVNTIADVAAKISKLVPEAKVEYAHGQMTERKLENIMYDFVNGEIDVLVSTTIIETGLDISNVNTIIIADSDNMGLSQLYQLRGRVGRSNRNAYAYLMYKRNKLIKEVAEKRLHAIKEFTELGSGIKIAMRDLEIRGAGNLLGEMQHGHMEAVGYDMYCKMLNEAVRMLKGEKVEEEFETVVDLKIDGFIPNDYIPNEVLKLDMYKKISGVESEEDYDDVCAELIDRFGDLPKPVVSLMDVALLKAKAHGYFITEIKQADDCVKIYLYEKSGIDINQIPVLVEKYRGNLRFVVDSRPHFVYRLRGFKVLKEMKEVVDSFEILLNTLNSNIE